MNAETILDAIDEQEWIEAPAAAVQKAALGAFEAGGEAGTKTKDFLHGRWFGHALHPALICVPLGAWMMAAIFDALAACGKRRQLDEAADVAIGVGLIGAVGAAVTGLTDWAPVEERPRKVGFVHAGFNIVATGLYLTSWCLRRNGEPEKRDLARNLAWTGFALSSLSGWLGGALVASEKMGVDNAPRENWPQEWTPVLDAQAVGEGKIVKTLVNDQEIVVARRNGELYALAHLCSHLAGPMAEGEFCDRDGEAALRCPWHGSCFALSDGRVLEGPATHPQPAFETRERDGKIEVRELQE